MLVFDGHQYGFSVVEEADRRPHEPTKAELAQKARYSWTRIPQWDYYPSGRLVVRLDDTYNRSRTARSRFGDGKRAQAEDKIADMVAELVERARLATEQRREAMRLDDLYAQERVAGVERAKLHYLEDLRARAAAEHAERWHQAERLRAYAEAMRKRPHNEGTDAWLDWITTRADRLDPPDLVPASPQLPEDIPEHQIHDYLRAWPQSRPYHWQPTE